MGLIGAAKAQTRWGPAPSVITITEFEETEIRDQDKGPEPPEEPPPESEER